MIPWIAALATTLIQKKQQDEAEDQARRNAISDISAQQAQSLGYPMYGLQATKFNQQLDQQGGQQNWLAAVLPALMKKDEEEEEGAM